MKEGPPGKVFLKTADAIGSEICNRAYWASSRCNWIGPALDDLPINAEPSYKISNKALSSEIYDGTAGIALFLSNLYYLTRREKYKDTAEGALRHALSRVRDTPNICRFGFYNGSVGVVYAAAKTGLTFKNNTLIEQASEELFRLDQDMVTEHLMDIISGNAGAIPALLEIHKIFHSEKILDLAVRLGNELVSSAVNEPFGWSWDHRVNGIQSSLHNLTGFAHGAAGIGYALLELFNQTDKKEFLNAAEYAFAYENHWFNKHNDNWPDFRVDSQTPAAHNSEEFVYSSGWCHGAPGIGLSRLRAYHILKGEKYFEDCDAALRTAARIVKGTKESNQVTNFSLCHGLAGVGELLLYGADILNNDSYRILASDLGRHGIARYVNKGLPWPCAIQAGETPGLLLGLAGIGNFYLRLFDSCRIPTPLLITPDQK